MRIFKSRRTKPNGEMNDKAGFSGLNITGNLGHLLNNVCGNIININKYMSLQVNITFIFRAIQPVNILNTKYYSPFFFKTQLQMCFSQHGLKSLNKVAFLILEYY